MSHGRGFPEFNGGNSPAGWIPVRERFLVATGDVWDGPFLQMTLKIGTGLAVAIMANINHAEVRSRFKPTTSVAGKESLEDKSPEETNVEISQNRQAHQGYLQTIIIGPCSRLINPVTEKIQGAQRHKILPELPDSRPVAILVRNVLKRTPGTRRFLFFHCQKTNQLRLM